MNSDCSGVCAYIVAHIFPFVDRKFIFLQKLCVGDLYIKNGTKQNLRTVCRVLFFFGIIFNLGISELFKNIVPALHHITIVIVNKIRSEARIEIGFYCG